MTKESHSDRFPLPGWVELGAYLHLAFLLMPVGLVAYAVLRQGQSITSFGFEVPAREHPGLYSALIMLRFVGGVAAVGILRRKRWGLTLGLIYSLVAMAACGLSFFFPAIPIGEPPVMEIILQGIFLCWIINTLKDSDHTSSPATAASGY